MNESTLITDFIINNLCVDNSQESIKDDTPLIENGIIDSLGVMKLVAYLEEEFGIRISPDDLIPENFETVALIAKLVKSQSAKG